MSNSVLLSCVGSCNNNNTVKMSTIQLDSFFSNLIDLLPPECYFDNDALAQLKLATDTVQSGQRGHNQHLRSKNVSPTLTTSKVTNYAQLMEIGEEKRKTTSHLKAKLHQRITQCATQRKGSKSGSTDSIKKKETRREKVIRKPTRKQLQKKSSIQNGSQSAEKKQPETLLFSRFAFMNDNETKPKDFGKKKLSNEKLLSIAEKREEKVNVLRLKDAESARQIEAKEAWHKALDKARGVKVKDDPKVLRRAIRQQRYSKRRSKRRWENIREQETAKQEERQRKRQHNLAKAKSIRVKAKMKRAVAKGHVLPGF